MLNWANRFNICCFLDNHQYNSSHHSIECVLAAGCRSSVSAPAGSALAEFQHFYDQSNDWVFGHLGYDLKNEIEVLSSANADGIGFPDLFFFIPEIVVQLNTSFISIGVDSDLHQSIFNEITGAGINLPAQEKVVIHDRFTRKEYVDTVEKLKQHILLGDCYEMNFCQEFFAENAAVSPVGLYISLSSSSPNPFSCFYKLDDKYLVCLSPERYLKKERQNIISQPIKGTSKRNRNNEQGSIQDLKNNPKERAENIMIVDLVRNDLSKICVKGSVHVDELCEIYTFPQVYQMISTVSGELQRDISVQEIIRATFPMGSMTGAPKKKVMELIEKYEKSRRGLFSGSIGYFTPEGDFDLNVVIRSVLYNQTTEYLSFHTGSAITFSSDAEAEYEECLLKAEAIRNVLK